MWNEIANERVAEFAVGSLLFVGNRNEPGCQWTSGSMVAWVESVQVWFATNGAAHLKIFAALARRLMHEEFRAALAVCSDADSIASVLRAERSLDPASDEF